MNDTPIDVLRAGAERMKELGFGSYFPQYGHQREHSETLLMYFAKEIYEAMINE